MKPNEALSTAGTQTGSNPGLYRESRPKTDQQEGFADEAVDAARKVYNEGERYLRTAYDRLPADMDRYAAVQFRSIH